MMNRQSAEADLGMFNIFGRTGTGGVATAVYRHIYPKIRPSNFYGVTITLKWLLKFYPKTIPSKFYTSPKQISGYAPDRDFTKSAPLAREWRTAARHFLAYEGLFAACYDIYKFTLCSTTLCGLIL